MTTSLRCGLLAIVLVAVPITCVCAQQSHPVPYASIAREGYRLGKAEAEMLEGALNRNPDDLAARTRLLGFYFRGAVKLYGPEATIAARRRHILWIIEHYPGSEAAGLSEATIDPAGHVLADKEGHQEASRLWTQTAQLHGNDPAVLGNAAKFFQLFDKEQAAALLKQAQVVAPNDSQWSGRLGYLYALGILGVDMINQNGLPTSYSPAEAQGAFAKHAREELEKSTDATMVGVAGRVLGQYGLMMGTLFRGSFALDYAPVAEGFLMKAQELESANPRWSGDLEQFRRLRSQAGQGK
jgi:hypothetical protein